MLSKAESVGVGAFSRLQVPLGSLFSDAMSVQHLAVVALHSAEEAAIAIHDEKAKLIVILEHTLKPTPGSFVKRIMSLDSV